jgi:Ca2+:H+ antiporter
MVRAILWASLLLAPVAIAADWGLHLGPTPLFVLSALALIPLAWLIGESTEHAAEHTGAGVGGFLNASFGNAPELIIALFAIADGLPEVVRGTITGSVVSNILLVLGAALIAGDGGEIDRRSLWLQIGAVGAATALLLVPSIPGWHGSPDRHSLYVATIPVAVVLLAAYVWLTVHNLRIHRSAERTEADAGAWSLATSLGVLTAATVATAFVSEVMVGSLEAFGHAVGLDEFFIAVVIVAIVGNAAEHGGAIVISLKGNLRLATEIAITSSMQVLLFVAPVVALLSFAVGHDLPLSLRPVEIATLALGAVAAAVVVANRRTTRSEGFVLLALYAAIVVAYYLSGNRDVS